MKKHVKRFAVLILDSIIFGLYLAVPYLTQWMAETVPACIFFKNGLRCPSCGGTRCIRDIRMGAYASAFRQNPFIFAMVLYFAGCILLLNLGYVFNLGFAKKAVSVAVHYKTILVIMVCFAAFGVLRNFV